MRHFFSNARKCGCERKEIESMIARALVSLVLLLLFAQSSLVQAQAVIGPTVGSSIKEFSLNDQHGSPKKLSELMSSGTTALIVVKSAGW